MQTLTWKCAASIFILNFIINFQHSNIHSFIYFDGIITFLHGLVISMHCFKQWITLEAWSISNQCKLRSNSHLYYITMPFVNFQNTLLFIFSTNQITDRFNFASFIYLVMIFIDTVSSNLYFKVSLLHLLITGQRSRERLSSLSKKILVQLSFIWLPLLNLNSLYQIK